MGYLKRDLASEDKQDMLALIEDYRQELVPLIVPMTLLQHHPPRHAVPPAVAATEGRPGEWVWQQAYLSPFPKELMLRNHM